MTMTQNRLDGGAHNNKSNVFSSDDYILDGRTDMFLTRTTKLNAVSAKFRWRMTLLLEHSRQKQ
jgi:hypothetical protein